MRLNTLSPAAGSKHAPKRVGRGMGSGLGKTAGRGHKAKSLVLVAVYAQDLKVVKCHLKSVYLNLVLPRVALW